MSELTAFSRQVGWRNQLMASRLHRRKSGERIEPSCLPPSAWLVKTRRAPSHHSRDGRVYGHTNTATHKLSTPPPPGRGGSARQMHPALSTLSYKYGNPVSWIVVTSRKRLTFCPTIACLVTQGKYGNPIRRIVGTSER